MRVNKRILHYVRRKLWARRQLIDYALEADRINFELHEKLCCYENGVKSDSRGSQSTFTIGGSGKWE